MKWLEKLGKIKIPIWLAVLAVMGELFFFGFMLRKAIIVECNYNRVMILASIPLENRGEPDLVSLEMERLTDQMRPMWK